MKFYVDECLSPGLALLLHGLGHDAIHPLHVGRLGIPDHLVLERCIAENRVLVTHNAGDFRKLVGRAALHPGLVVLAESARERSVELLAAALAAIESGADGARPEDFMINRIVDVGRDGAVATTLLPPLDD